MVALREQTSGMELTIPLPVPNNRLFRYAATGDILTLLANNPHTRFSIRDIRRATDHSPSSVTDTVDLLAETDLVHITREGNRKLVQINRERLTKPDDPVLQIPQSEFHDPVRTLVDTLRSRIDNIAGILVFGSVARGEADRSSDIDCFVLVTDEKATAQRIAHEVARDLEEQRFAGDRYQFQVLAESMESVSNIGDRLREIFTEGIVLYETEHLHTAKQEVLTNGQ
ncbi:nucleotidyltransferase domain-containing protein [Halogeometricum pallidum]|uniref:nucleotidyltransferase domain-containing protein n=1 Tax=Halogeometricum pallidum TaxID=411361 RepID=UPI000677BBB3|nr:nucleotidyltransferase domain-containing protein [Halogeometricum pallidum]